MHNNSDVWLDVFPRPTLDGHKYNRGQALIFGAPLLTGATRLAASSCSRMGAGLVTIVAHSNADIYRTTLDADIMVTDGRNVNAAKINVLLGGSGGIHGGDYQDLLSNRYNCPRVFDADAIPDVQDFFRLDAQCVLTPHGGEFARKFPRLSGSKVQKAVEAAKISGAIIVLKGAETITAHPEGHYIVNNHASPYLAKAGTGDVLAGMITGLIAQGMPLFEACCAAVWMHGEIGIRIGPGLIATDIIDLIPEILTHILV